MTQIHADVKQGWMFGPGDAKLESACQCYPKSLLSKRFVKNHKTARSHVLPRFHAQLFDICVYLCHLRIITRSTDDTDTRRCKTGMDVRARRCQTRIRMSVLSKISFFGGIFFLARKRCLKKAILKKTFVYLFKMAFCKPWFGQRCEIDIPCSSW